MDNSYLDADSVHRAIARSSHRDVVGGAWDEIGKLQFDWLRAKGLRPHHALLDVGCGALRGGIHFVPYLAVGHYYGVDASSELLECGRAELRLIRAEERLPAANLMCSENFDVRGFGRRFEFALAQSLFTHLKMNAIRRCLAEVADVLSDDGVFYATFFHRPDDAPARDTRRHAPADVVTHDTQDPYHYSVEDFRHLCRGLPLAVDYIGDWAHPRGQQMIAFHARRRPSPAWRAILSHISRGRA